MKPVRIGTRSSPLALWQARTVATAIERSKELSCELVAIKTTGDRLSETMLSEMGGKVTFVKEIEQALISEEADIAVHSMKDMPSELPEGLVLASILEREDPRDAFIGKDALALEVLPEGAVVGTASLRRQAQLLAFRPDLNIVPFRGNVGTRIDKIKAGHADATLLALAGLKRLGMEGAATQVISPDVILPAVAQGAIGIECRSDDARVGEALAAINDEESALCVSVERAFLAILDGSCQTPIGGLAELARGRVNLRALIAKPDGTEVKRAHGDADPTDALTMAADLGRELRTAIGPDFFAQN